MYSPVKPEMTVDELAEHDSLDHEILMVILNEAAKNVYRQDPSQGLERCLEEIIDLLNRGYIKVITDDDLEMIRLGIFNPLTGKYNAEHMVDDEG